MNGYHELRRIIGGSVGCFLAISSELSSPLLIPNEGALRANGFATAAADARASREPLWAKILRIITHPTHRKLMTLSSGVLMVSAMLAIAYFVVVYWGWTLSREIYEVLISTIAPQIPFLGKVARANTVCKTDFQNGLKYEAVRETARQSRQFIKPKWFGRAFERAQQGIAENRELKIVLKYAVRVAAVVGPLSGLPQVLSIWISMNSSGVSLVSWSLFLAISFLWLLHALSQNDRALVISNSLWIIIDATIIAGALVSRMFKT
jgi:uncharacterized protein with PQ loop repeat